MPIRPEHRERYPSDWAAISLRIRVGRAQHRCECTGQCGADHHRYGSEPRCHAQHGHPHPVTESPVVLTVAHLDRTPEHNQDGNLLAMCQDCHLAYDLEDHVAQGLWTRSVNRLGERRNHELFPAPLGHDEPRREPEPTLPYFWRVRTTLGERHGSACRILARGRLNSILVEFADGTRHIVSGWSIRRRRISEARR